MFSFFRWHKGLKLKRGELDSQDDLDIVELPRRENPLHLDFSDSRVPHKAASDSQRLHWSLALESELASRLLNRPLSKQLEGESHFLGLSDRSLDLIAGDFLVTGLALVLQLHLEVVSNLGCEVKVLVLSLGVCDLDKQVDKPV